MSEHFSQSDLEAYVMGSIDEAAAERLERHVARCARCSAALAREAELEELLHAAAAQPPPARQPAPRRLRRWPLWIPLAAAAAWLCWFIARPEDPAERLDPQLAEVLPPLGICDRRPDLCAEPARHGIVSPEAGVAAAPRYEEMGPARLTWRDGDEPRREEQR